MCVLHPEGLPASSHHTGGWLYCTWNADGIHLVPFSTERAPRTWFVLSSGFLFKAYLEEDPFSLLDEEDDDEGEMALDEEEEGENGAASIEIVGFVHHIFTSNEELIGGCHVRLNKRA